MQDQAIKILDERQLKLAPAGCGPTGEVSADKPPC